jgi:6-phosphogluconate dehydrogenase (decarboxylating)
MQLGMIGLGRMGANMVRRFSREATIAWKAKSLIRGDKPG